MDCIVHGVAKSQTGLSDLYCQTFCRGRYKSLAVTEITPLMDTSTLRASILFRSILNPLRAHSWGEGVWLQLDGPNILCLLV